MKATKRNPELMDTSGFPHPGGVAHKFFSRDLQCDLSLLRDFLLAQNQQMESGSFPGITQISQDDYWLDSGSIPSIKWRDYNIFQFYRDDIYMLYKEISSMAKEACAYYGIDFAEQKYMIQGWFNVNYAGKGKLGWHNHGGPWMPFLHGYYCVSAGHSTTEFEILGKSISIENEDNRIILSEMGHPHRMGDWAWSGPRITIAFDLLPLKTVKSMNAVPQHWIPLL